MYSISRTCFCKIFCLYWLKIYMEILNWIIYVKTKWPPLGNLCNDSYYSETRYTIINYRGRDRRRTKKRCNAQLLVQCAVKMRFLLGGLSLHLNHLIAERVSAPYRQFGTLPIGIFLSNLDSGQLETSLMTSYCHF